MLENVLFLEKKRTIQLHFCIIIRKKISINLTEAANFAYSLFDVFLSLSCLVCVSKTLCSSSQKKNESEVWRSILFFKLIITNFFR